MDSNINIRDASNWTMFVFGASALLFGLLGLMLPALLSSLLGFPIESRKVPQPVAIKVLVAKKSGNK